MLFIEPKTDNIEIFRFPFWKAYIAKDEGMVNVCKGLKSKRSRKTAVALLFSRPQRVTN